MGRDKSLSELCRTWKLSQMGRDKKPIRTLSDLKIVTNGAWQKTYPNSVGLENCHNNRRQYPGTRRIHCTLEKTYPTLHWNLTDLRMSRNLCHKSSPIPLWNLTDSQIVTNGSWQKPIRTLSDLKIVTNGAWQKTYPNSVGLENCHKWGVTKNLSDICRTWFVSRSANLTQLVGPNCVTAWVRLFFRASKKFT